MPAALTYLGDGHALQDLAYGYDLVGNVVAIHDRTPGSGIPGTPPPRTLSTGVFTYDPLYRLRSATGRECDDPSLPPPWRDEVRCADPAHTRSYAETYDYDAAGDMTLLRHTPAPGGYDRVFTLAPGTNRVQQVTDAGAPRAYRYDDNGNLVQEHGTPAGVGFRRPAVRVRRASCPGRPAGNPVRVPRWRRWGAGEEVRSRPAGPGQRHRGYRRRVRAPRQRPGRERHAARDGRRRADRDRPRG
jgi:YD repeat-containing protein